MKPLITTYYTLTLCLVFLYGLREKRDAQSAKRTAQPPRDTLRAGKARANDRSYRLNGE